MTAILNFLKKFPIEKAIATALLIAACLIAIQIILRIFDRFTKRSKLDTLVGKILRTVLKAFLLFTATIIVLGSLGIPVSSLIALLSIIGVAPISRRALRAEASELQNTTDS